VLPTITELGIHQLTLEDRLLLAEAIWQSVVAEQEQAEIPASQLAELERRLADSIARPEATIPWEEVKARALARAQQ
jgi:putative addiction module component (TIGR02574 family)